MNQADPVQEYFSIGEVCDLTGLRPHVLRYWESQFRFLSPTKNRSGNRVYQRREVDLIMLVKHLLYTEKYTIEGARQKVDEHKKSQDLQHAARGALNVEALEALAGKQTVAEGVVTARSAGQLAKKHDVEMPIVEMVNRILFEGHNARGAVTEMMTRELRPEQDA